MLLDSPPVPTDQKAGGSNPSERATPHQPLPVIPVRPHSPGSAPDCTKLHISLHDGSSRSECATLKSPSPGATPPDLAACPTPCHSTTASLTPAPRSKR